MISVEPKIAPHEIESLARLSGMTSRWTVDQACDWYARQPFLTGANFTPSVAINQLEMWQAETWDPATIDRELGWAAGIGMNTVRTYLHDLAWSSDPAGFLSRVDEFLAIASKHGIRPVLVFFDDCWRPEGGIGKQPEPQPGIHNSGWLQSPLKNERANPAALEPYVTSVVGNFAKDNRILMWDVYNEPGNVGHGRTSEPLVRFAAEWARSVDPIQPITIGAWGADAEFDQIMIDLSDIPSFHYYEAIEGFAEHLEKWNFEGRPIICTEWLARRNQRVEDFLPAFKARNIGCINWGLVDGNIQTKYAWGEPLPGVEPDPWFHDLFQADGTPYSADEADLFRSIRN